MEKKLLTHIFVIYLFCGCASLSDEGRKVRLASQLGNDCKFLGSIDGSIWVNNGDNHLKNQAAQMGGNWIVVTGYRNEGIFSGSKPSTGEVYKCAESNGSARIVNKTIDLNINSNYQEKGNSGSQKKDIYESLKKLKV